MTSIINRSKFVGNLVKDGVYQLTNGGTHIYKITIAVFNGYKKDAQGNKIIGANGFPEKETLFVNLTAFGKAAETLVNKKDNELTKGAFVMVEARYNGYSTFQKSDNSGMGVNVDFVIDSATDVVIGKPGAPRQDTQGQVYNNNQPNYGNQGQPGGYPNQSQSGQQNQMNYGQQNQPQYGQQHQPSYNYGGFVGTDNSTEPEDLPF